MLGVLKAPERSGMIPSVFARVAALSEALITQMAQIAACNRHHSLHQQRCRLLLLRLDRLRNSEPAMKQAMAARIVAVRHEGLSEAAVKLQKAGLIRFARGHISVLDRARLEERNCECHAAVRNEYERLRPNCMVS
jgi:hypothetical protein